ncbi:MAG TPA: hypothetical protein VMF09_02680 [Solirubrobacteraceae bacterium]|nr:hypothetical protein [Solirubrobacteraceae bacterium]
MILRSQARVVLLGIATLLLGAATALATPGTVGYDVSYPQCEIALPPSASFAIVGVNGGLANDPNPCLVQQLMWAVSAPGLRRAGLPGVSLYLNAADPGDDVADWPSPGAGTATAKTPYGTCDGSWSRACAFTYATSRAAYSYALAATAAPAATAMALPVAASAPWWIDVETGASWATRSGSREWAQLNVAALRGYLAGLRAAGARGPVGLYSDAYQWRAITGLAPRASGAYFSHAIHDWVSGSTSLARARRACARAFSGSAVTIAQFTEGAYDRDYACPALRRRAARRRG